MQGFIEQIAYKLYEKMGDDISSLYIMFPSRRARLFFAEALSKVADRPLWQPNYISVDEIMTELSDLAKGEHVRLIVELYQVYSKYHKESFDSFYFWGEMLIADFDAVDKYLIDADMLFANVSDLKSLESDFSYLTDEQIAVISQFWKSFGAESEFSREKQQFIDIWKTLAPIYHAYRSRLSELGIAYSGMIYRRAAERVKSGQTVGFAKDRHYVIAGFNALSESEKVVFDFLAAESAVDFFWDHDDYYVHSRDQEAGLFIRENINRYPQTIALPYSYRGFTEPKNITVVGAPSDSLQCKYVGEFLRELDSLAGHTPDKETAVVLTDESLLLPVLYSIPDSVGNINITMGYPFRQTLVYSFVERLIELQNRKRTKGTRETFYHSDVVGLLSHPFVQEQQHSVADRLIADVLRRQQVYVSREQLDEGGLVSSIFRKVESWSDMSIYIVEVSSVIAEHPSGEELDSISRAEYFTVLTDHITRLHNSLEDCSVELSLAIYTSLLRRLLQTVRIPYEGEPLEGVQVMGILETRNLDFENVLLLSVNDDTFPGSRSSSSFIPHNLRYAYGMPTPAHHEGVFAYYFYRLLQRAKNIHIVYCSRSDDKNSGERSRYIHQLIYESPHKVRVRNISVDVNLAPTAPVAVEKTDEVLAVLYEYLDEKGRKLSPTSLYSYIECPLKFYFRAIARLSKDDEVVEEIDSPMFGSILHKAMQLLYTPILDRPNVSDYIRSLIGSKAVDDAVEKAINTTYLNDTSPTQYDYSGNVVLVRDIVVKYLNCCLLPYDARNGGFTVVKLEEPIGCKFEVEVDGMKRLLSLGGYADRIDRLADGTMRIVDYKTGSLHLEFAGLDALFATNAKDRSSAVLQTLMYAMMLSRSEKCDVQPALYYVRKLNSEDYSPLLMDKSSGLEVRHYADYREKFETLLSAVIADIFNPTKAFTQCEDSSVCEWCDYNQICRRK